MLPKDMKGSPETIDIYYTKQTNKTIVFVSNFQQFSL